MIKTTIILFTSFAIDVIIKRKSCERQGPIVLFIGFLICEIFRIDKLMGYKISKNNRHYYYNSRKNAIIFCPDGNSFSLAKRVFYPDIETMECFENLYWAKDKRSIYYKSHNLDYLNIDIPSFQVKAYSWAIDKNNVYSLKYDSFQDEPVEIVRRANPKTYQIIDCEWAQDSEICFYWNKPTLIDANSSEILNANFVKDKDLIYVIPSAKWEDNYTSFETIETDLDQIVVFDTYLIRDHKYIYSYCSYYKGQVNNKLIKIPFINPHQIKIDLNEYMRVDHKIYYQSHEITNAHAESFKELKNFYYRDKYRLYFEGVAFENVDFNSLKYNEEYFCYEDKNYRYERENKIKLSSN
ncbi:MAG: DKNYY domain-containing protein [Marinifilaceae bacterium]|jgi:hypothetical protein|nr:DKNYY domain-containing protein [Marinifilaceae bacterium]